MVLKNVMKLISVFFHFLLLLLSYSGQATAHEVIPNIADIRIEGKSIKIKLRLNLEAYLSGMDLSELVNTDNAEQFNDYRKLRSLSPSELTAAFESNWIDFTDLIQVRDDKGSLVNDFLFGSLIVEDLKNVDLPRLSTLNFTINNQKDLSGLTIAFDQRLGSTFLRQSGVQYGLEQSLAAGQVSGLINATGNKKQSSFNRFLYYIAIGFDHVVPNGFDHILFVLGLFLLSLKTSILLWQVSAFTVAHTITLIFGSFGAISLPASIVEPLIAASIVFVAVENVFFSKINPWRTKIVFIFGLLHGLGFASVLADFGLPTGEFIPALIGFNVGVELGQLSVIAIAFVTLGLPFGKSRHYRNRVTIPTSLLVALIGIYWIMERTIFT